MALRHTRPHTVSMTQLNQIVAHANLVIYEKLMADAAKAKHGGFADFGRRYWKDLVDEARAMKASTDA